MKRLLLFALLLLAVGFVQAQQACTANLTEADCELYEEAINELYDDGRLYFRYVLQAELNYQATSKRRIFGLGSGYLERNDDGEITNFEIEIVNHVQSEEVYARDGRNYALPVRMKFEDNLLAYAFGVDPVEAVELDADSFPIESLFPSLDPAIQIDEYFVQNQELEGGSITVFQYSKTSALIDSPFQSIYPLLFGEAVSDLSGTGYYEGNLAILPTTEEVYGAVFRSIETIDGAAFGQVLPITVQIQYDLHIIEEIPILEPITEIDIHHDDASDFEDSMNMLFISALTPVLDERMLEIFPPISE